ncbi:MAG: hypothetical protein ACE5DS_10215, partial [Kiloniellaceae bacterium]
MVWPAIPDRRGAGVLAILYQLEQSQWWRREELLDRQFQQLSLLVAHAHRSLPFYHERFARAGIDPARPLGPGDWCRLPLLTRAAVQDAGEALLSRAVPASHGRLSEVHTSGSTGRPIRAWRTQLWELYWSAFTIRDHLWQRRDMRAKLAAIRDSGKGKAPYPKGTTAPNWGRASGQVFKTGPCVGLNILCSIAQQV